jgi:hypothetical protein
MIQNEQTRSLQTFDSIESPYLESTEDNPEQAEHTGDLRRVSLHGLPGSFRDL